MMDKYAANADGIQLFKGDIVRLEEDEQLYEVAEDNERITEPTLPNVWGSVRLVNNYPPHFTHKGGIYLVSRSRT